MADTDTVPQPQTAAPVQPPPAAGAPAGPTNPLWTMGDRSQAAEQPGGLEHEAGSFGNIRDALTKRQQMIGEVQKSMQRSDQLQQEKSRALAPHEGALNTALSTPPPAPPQRQSVAGSPPPAITEQDGKNMVAFGSAMALIGAIGSRFMHVPAEAAMNAFSGAIKGYKEGNQQLFENSYKEWEANTKKTIENNKIITDEYREILANRQFGIEDMKTRMLLAATKYQDALQMEAAKRGDYMQMAQIYEKQVDAGQRAQVAFEKLKAQGAAGASPADLDKQADQYVAQGGVGFGVKQINQPGMQQAIDRSLERQNLTRADLAVKRVKYTSDLAEGRVLGARAGNIETSVEELRELAPLALEANRRLPRSDLVPLNQLQQQGQRMTSNPDYIALNAYTQGIITAYAATMSRSGANTVHAQQRADHVISTATGPNGYETAVQTLLHEADAVERAPENARRRLAQSILGNSGGGAQAPGGPGTQAAPAPPKAGEVRKGYRFKGGDPANKDSWEPVQ